MSAGSFQRRPIQKFDAIELFESQAFRTRLRAIEDFGAKSRINVRGYEHERARVTSRPTRLWAHSDVPLTESRGPQGEPETTARCLTRGTW